MTKLTFDVDFNKDPEEILREIQERARAVVAKQELKLKSVSFLSTLHEKVNEEIGTDYKSINDLIRALTQFANPKLKDKISSTSLTGRRVTVSMTRDLFLEIKSKLSQPNPNKAAIARETGLSVVQVRKVATGGYDSKFSSQSSSRPIDQDELKLTSGIDSTQAPRSIDNIPKPESLQPSPSQASVLQPPSIAEPIAPPSFGEEIADVPPPISPPPPPSFELPSSTLPPKKEEQVSFSEYKSPLNKSLTSLPKPSLPPTPNKDTSDKGKMSKLPLLPKSGKKKTGGLKITRPPMKPPSA